jgi:hypothetical protein
MNTKDRDKVFLGSSVQTAREADISPPSMNLFSRRCGIPNILQLNMLSGPVTEIVSCPGIFRPTDEWH